MVEAQRQTAGETMKMGMLKTNLLGRPPMSLMVQQMGQN